MPDTEAWRHECECRHWLNDGYTTRAKVDQLMARIEKKRGKAAAERLREGMREAWRQRS